VGEKLVVAVFDDHRAAWDAVVDAAQIASAKRPGIHDACLVVRQDDGTVDVRETGDISPRKAGFYGGAWGLVAGVVLGFPVVAAAAGAGIGVFAARRRDIGVTDAFEREVAKQLEPGKAAAVALADEDAVPAVEAAARRRGAWTIAVALERPELDAAMRAGGAQT
jgi:uncharacterized membrane protein